MIHSFHLDIHERYASHNHAEGPHVGLLECLERSSEGDGERFVVSDELACHVEVGERPSSYVRQSTSERCVYGCARRLDAVELEFWLVEQLGE